MASHNDEEGLQSVVFTGPDSAQYRPALHRFLVRRLHNAEDAKDLAQEAYLRFYQLANTQAIRRPSGYLFRIAVNLVYEFRLRGRRDCVTYDSEMVDALGEHSADPGATDPGERLAAAEQLNRVLERIPPTYRRVLIMHLRDGLSCEDIATALNLTKPSVRVYLARAVAFARNARWQ